MTRWLRKLINRLKRWKKRKERRRKNEEGHKRGFSKCMRCGDSWSWKTHHDVPYYWEKSYGMVLSGMFPCCEECWQVMTKEAKIKYCDKLIDAWEKIEWPPLPDGRKPLKQDNHDEIRKNVRWSIENGEPETVDVKEQQCLEE